jgi:hypothetical protein
LLLGLGAVYALIFSIIVLRSLIIPPGIVENWDMTWPIAKETYSLPFYAWDSLRSAPTISTPFAPMYSLFIITNSTELVSKALMVFTLFACSFSAFSLVYFLNKERNDPYRAIMCFFAGTIAILNPFVFTRFFQLSMLWGFALAPLTLLFFIKGLRKEKSWIRSMVIASIILAFSSMSVHAGVWTLILLGCYFLYQLLFISKKDSILRFFKKTAVFLTVYVGLVAYWIFPTLFSNLAKHPYFENTVEAVSFLSNNASFFNVIRLTGAQALTRLDFVYNPEYLKTINDPLDPNISSITLGIQSWVFTLLTLIPPILAILALLLRRKDKFVVFFALLIPLGIFLGQGTNPGSPLGSAYSWLMFSSPLSSVGWLFRDPNRALSLHFSLSCNRW